MNYTRVDGYLGFAEGYRNGRLVIVSISLQGCANEIFTLETSDAVKNVLVQELENRGAA